MPHGVLSDGVLSGWGFVWVLSAYMQVSEVLHAQKA